MVPKNARRSHLAVLGLAAVVAACEIPSDPPIFQQTWVVPGDSIAVAVSQILPANILLNGGGTAFLVTVPAPAAFNTTLGALCGQAACQSPTAVVAPIPAFTSTGAALTRTVNFPATVAGATVVSGTVNLAFNNQLGFDPLRPNGASPAYGSMTVTITNGAVNTPVVFNGATQSMPNGAVTQLQIPVPAGTYGGTFSVSVAFNVPAGGNASMASGNSFGVTPTINNLTVSQATVVVAADSINTTPTNYDLDDVDFADHVEGGGLLLDIVNPFTAGATAQLVITAPDGGPGKPPVTVTKNVTIAATPTSNTSITLSKAELQSLVGRSGVQMSVKGTATGTGAGNTVTVTPAQRITIRTQMQLLLNVGG